MLIKTSDVCFQSGTSRLNFLLLMGWDFLIPASHLLQPAGTVSVFKHSQKNFTLIQLLYLLIRSISSIVVTEVFYDLDLLAERFIF